MIVRRPGSDDRENMKQARAHAEKIRKIETTPPKHQTFYIVNRRRALKKLKEG